MTRRLTKTKRLDLQHESMANFAEMLLAGSDGDLLMARLFTYAALDGEDDMRVHWACIALLSEGAAHEFERLRVLAAAFGCRDLEALTEALAVLDRPRCGEAATGASGGVTAPEMEATG